MGQECCICRKNSFFPFALSLVFVGLVIGCASAPHGEGKRGPHGGYIKMPGQFHVEVVPQSDNELIVYLLDLQSRDPLTLASGLKGQLEQASGVQSFACDIMADHYKCKLPEGSDLTIGEITIQAVRKERVGRPATFQLPFRVIGE